MSKKDGIREERHWAVYSPAYDSIDYNTVSESRYEAMDLACGNWRVGGKAQWENLKKQGWRLVRIHVRYKRQINMNWFINYDDKHRWVKTKK